MLYYTITINILLLYYLHHMHKSPFLSAEWPRTVSVYSVKNSLSSNTYGCALVTAIDPPPKLFPYFHIHSLRGPCIPEGHSVVIVRSR